MSNTRAGTLGVDFVVKALAACSDGTALEGPNPSSLTCKAAPSTNRLAQAGRSSRQQAVSGVWDAGRGLALLHNGYRRNDCGHVEDRDLHVSQMGTSRRAAGESGACGRSEAGRPRIRRVNAGSGGRNQAYP